MPTNKLTFIDLFAGIGGFRKGMELAGHKCMGFCEWDKFATASYTSMHLITDEQRQKLAGMSLKERQKEILKDEYRNGEWYSPDIRQVGAGNVPRVDCWCFGAPCQSFSLAGKREGLDGKSGLIREVFRILGELEEKDRPEWLIYENVKGMLSSNRGGDFLSIILAMEELGYDIEWYLFNSKYHGVPQNRERVYTVGHLRRYGPRKIFPIKGTNGADSADIKIAGHYNGYRRNMQTFTPDGITEALSTCGGGNREHHVALPLVIQGHEAFTLTAQDKHGVALGLNTENDGTSRTIKAQYSKNSAANFIRSDSLGATGVIEVRGGLQEHQKWNDCEQGVVVPVIWYDKYKCYIAIRKLTPKECFRLQAFTDEEFDKAQFVNSNSQLYKQAGNSVTVSVVYEIAKAIAKTSQNAQREPTINE